MAKIRQGFVSNSSSSSFVLAGIQIKQDSIDNDTLENLYEKDFSVRFPGEDGAPEKCYLIGTELASFDDDDYSEGSHFSLQEVLDAINKAKTAVPLKEEEYIATGLFTGTRVC